MNAKPEYFEPETPRSVAIRDEESARAVATAPATQESAALIAMIERAARDPNVDIDKMERLYLMHERAKEASRRAQFAEALAQMQPEMPVIERRGKNTNTKQAYAKWEDIASAITPVLSRHGFSLSFKVDTTEKVSVTGILMHAGGHREETSIVLPVDAGAGRNAVQAVGSSVSYGKRYVAGALLNFVSSDEVDNDGNGATITDEQVKELRDLLDERGRDVRRFCEHIGVESLRDIFPDRFAAAKKLILQTPPKDKPKGDAA